MRGCAVNTSASSASPAFSAKPASRAISAIGVPVVGCDDEVPAPRDIVRRGCATSVSIVRVWSLNASLPDRPHVPPVRHAPCPSANQKAIHYRISCYSPLGGRHPTRIAIAVRVEFVPRRRALGVEGFHEFRRCPRGRLIAVVAADSARNGFPKDMQS